MVKTIITVDERKKERKKEPQLTTHAYIYIYIYIYVVYIPFVYVASQVTISRCVPKRAMFSSAQVPYGVTSGCSINGSQAEVEISFPPQDSLAVLGGILTLPYRTLECDTPMEGPSPMLL